jgi:hypothetical protein
MPQIGELAPGVWLASGFGGHGLNTTAMAGNIIARAMVDGDQTWRQFTPFELVWAGGWLGRAAVQMRNWIKRRRDRIAEHRAQARAVAARHARVVETPTPPAAPEYVATEHAVGPQDIMAPPPAENEIASAPQAPAVQPPAIDEAVEQTLPSAAPQQPARRRRRRRERAPGAGEP